MNVYVLRDENGELLNHYYRLLEDAQTHVDQHPTHTIGEMNLLDFLRELADSGHAEVYRGSGPAPCFISLDNLLAAMGPSGKPR